MKSDIMPLGFQIQDLGGLIWTIYEETAPVSYCISSSTVQILLYLYFL